jgi:hypothetical protein
MDVYIPSASRRSPTNVANVKRGANNGREVGEAECGTAVE